MPKVVAADMAQLSTLLSRESYETLKELAEKNGRTIRGQLEIMIEEQSNTYESLEERVDRLEGILAQRGRKAS